MGADMIAEILWTENGELAKDKTLQMLRAAIDAETDWDTLYEAARYANADVDELAREVILADPVANASWRAKIVDGYAQRIDELTQSFRSREVTTITLGPLIGYLSAGLSWGETPTEVMDEWNTILFDDDPETRAHPYTHLLTRYLLVLDPTWVTDPQPGMRLANVALADA